MDQIKELIASINKTKEVQKNVEKELGFQLFCNTPTFIQLHSEDFKKVFSEYKTRAFDDEYVELYTEVDGFEVIALESIEKVQPEGYAEASESLVSSIES